VNFCAASKVATVELVGFRIMGPFGFTDRHTCFADFGPTAEADVSAGKTLRWCVVLHKNGAFSL